eukprot:m.832707 g.832707  ORF g.832707 m.832707 type:complete len:348 (+) comp23439_c0_seq1:173-1216(+)
MPPQIGFGSQSSRFETRGVGHPNAKAPGTCIAMSYQADARTSSALARVNVRKPGTAPPGRTHGPSQRPRTLPAPLRTRSAPSAAVRALRASKAEEATRGGPAYYTVASTPPFARRRIHTAIDHPGGRFATDISVRLPTPGPGRYGDGKGVTPYSGIERQGLHASARGVIDTSTRTEILRLRDSGLGPNAYEVRGSLELPPARRTTTERMSYGSPSSSLVSTTAAGGLGPGSYNTPPLDATPGALEYKHVVGRTPLLHTSDAPDVFYSLPQRSKSVSPSHAPFGTAADRWRKSGTTVSPGVGPEQYALQASWTEPRGSHPQRDWPGYPSHRHTHHSSLQSRSLRFPRA